MKSKAMQTAVREIINLICDRRFESALQRCAMSRLTISDIETLIDDYGRTLTRPPAEAEQFEDVVYVEGRPEPTWSSRVPLWTIEEGRSDLTVDFTITQKDDGLSIELDNIGVL